MAEGRNAGGFGLGFLDDEMDGPARRGRKSAGPRLRFGAIGVAFGLLGQQMGTWVLAALVVAAGNAAVGPLLGLSIGGQFGLRVQFGGGFPITLGHRPGATQVVLSALVYGLSLGAMTRMACLQVRGRRIRLADLFGVGDCLVELAFASALIGLATLAGFACLVLPGFVIPALLMFALPLVVDARLTALAALRRSWGALKGEWLTATAFHLVLALVAGSGALYCGLGIVFTAPLYSLTIAVLYAETFLDKGSAKGL